MLTSQMVKQYASSHGIDGIAIGPTSRFEGAPRQMDPRFLFPEAKSFIMILGRIPRGAYRGIEEGTNWPNYTFYGYYALNMIFNPSKVYDLCTFIEDHGHEACPHYPGVPEAQPVPGTAPLREGAPPPQVTAQVRIAAAAAGLGQIGHHKNFMSKRFGPRVRLATILTDAELDCDPIQEQDLCDHCMACVAECPGSAIPPAKDGENIEITIEGRTISWGDVHMGKCALTHNGMNRKTNPFLHRDLPGLDLDVAKQDGMSQEEAHRLGYALLRHGRFRRTAEFPSDRISPYVSNTVHTWWYCALCGAKGCILACLDHLEDKKKITCLFHNKRRKRPAWKLGGPRKVAPRSAEHLM